MAVRLGARHDPVTECNFLVSNDEDEMAQIPDSIKAAERANVPLLTLLVDDEPELRAVLEDALSESGHQVVTAADGAEAMVVMANIVFDVVICDVRLPKVDGFALLRHLHAHTPQTKVIMITAYGHVPDAVSALKQGAYDYLSKPFDIKELLEQLRRIGKHAGSGSAPRA